MDTQIVDLGIAPALDEMPDDFSELDHRLEMKGWSVFPLVASLFLPEVPDLNLRNVVNAPNWHVSVAEGIIKRLIFLFDLYLGFDYLETSHKLWVNYASWNVLQHTNRLAIAYVFCIPYTPPSEITKKKKNLKLRNTHNALSFVTLCMCMYKA